MMIAMITAVPGISICRSFSFQVAGVGAAVGGALKVKKMMAAARPDVALVFALNSLKNRECLPPIGKLM